jgi:hypothetical protein
VAVSPLTRIVSLHPTYRQQEMRPLLDWVASRRQPGDDVFVWYRAAPNVLWYSAAAGFDPQQLRWGGCWLDQPRRFLYDLEPLRGRRRVWFVTAGGRSAELKLLSSYVEQIGRLIDRQTVRATLPGYLSMEAWLYDFSDPARLARATAASFPITLPAAPGQAVLACRDGPMAVEPVLATVRAATAVASPSPTTSDSTGSE